MSEVAGSPSLAAAGTVHLAIAGLDYTFLSSRLEVGSALRERFPHEMQSLPTGDSLVTLVEILPGPMDEEDVHAQMRAEGRRLEFFGAPGFAGEVDLSRNEGTLRIWPRDIGMRLENYLRMVNAARVLGHGGIQLHSSSVIRGGHGYVFFGPSDAGKTTVAGLSAAYSVLSDDQCVLRVDGDAVTLVGVPFRGVFCPVETARGSAPLARQLRLQQDTKTWLEPVRPAEAIGMLASQATAVNIQPALADRLLHNCSEIAARVAVERLHFTRSAELWEIL